MVLDHVAYGQILDHDRLIVTNESSSEFVQVIATPVPDAGVHPSDLPTCLPAIARVGLLAGQLPLSAHHPLTVMAFMAQVADFFACRQSDQVVKAGIYADGRLDARQGLDGFLA